MADEEKTKKYLNLQHDDFVKDLKQWSKIFFPKASKDLDNKASSGRHMLEMSAFIGDVLSFYLEDRFRNSNLLMANQPENVVDLAEAQGYKFIGPSPARGLQSFYLEVPSTTGSIGNFIPDMKYSINFKNVQLQNTNGIIFETLDDVDFTALDISSSLNVQVSKRNASGQPTHFVLKTNIEVIAGKTQTETFSVGQYKPFKEIQISEKNILDILSVKDSDGNDWFEVDWLAQEAIFQIDRNANSDSLNVPYRLRIITVPRRFVKKVNPITGQTTLTFGPGKAASVGDPVVPDVSMLSLDLKGKLTFSPTSIDPQNFLNAKSLGLAPYNTTLTIKFRTGGGLITNTSEASLNNIISKEPQYSSAGLNSQELNNTLASLSSRNLSTIEGGDDAPSIDIIKQNAAAFFASQMRLNTKEDYISRLSSIPTKLGTVFRSYPTTNFNNGGVQISVLAKNNLGQITVPAETLKKNIKNYLSLFTRQGQSIDILDGKIINIGIEYSVVIDGGFSKSKVKLDTLLKVKDFFNINKWQLNQPIIIDEIRCLIKETPGVVSISDFIIINKSNIVNGLQYSEFSYDVIGNTKNGIVFGVPEGIFEIKYGDLDIKVAAI